MADQQSELDARSLRSGRRRQRVGIVFGERNDDQSVIVIAAGFVHGVTLAKTVRLDARDDPLTETIAKQIAQAVQSDEKQAHPCVTTKHTNSSERVS